MVQESQTYSAVRTPSCYINNSKILTLSILAVDNAECMTTGISSSVMYLLPIDKAWPFAKFLSCSIALLGTSIFLVCLQSPKLGRMRSALQPQEPLFNQLIHPYFQICELQEIFNSNSSDIEPQPKSEFHTTYFL